MNPHFKLLFTLVDFTQAPSDDPIDPDHVEEVSSLSWIVPRTILPDDMESSLTVLEKYLKEPMDLEGRTVEELLRKKRKRSVRRRRARNGDDPDRPARRRRQKRQAAETQQHKSAEFIQDSEEDEEADRIFSPKRRPCGKPIEPRLRDMEEDS